MPKRLVARAKLAAITIQDARVEIIVKNVPKYRTN